MSDTVSSTDASETSVSQPPAALSGLTVVDVGGTIATGYCGKLCADYGARVINLEGPSGFATRRAAPFVPGLAAPESSALHAYLQAKKLSVAADQLSGAQQSALLATADLVLDAGELPSNDTLKAVRMSILWFGADSPYADRQGTDAQCFALNGMLRGIGRVEGPPLIPTGYQAEMVGGISAFIGSLGHVLAAELGNRHGPIHLETSIYEAMMCFTDVGVIGAYNSGLEASRMGINRFPPTYPLGVFPCQDGWLGVTVLTPSQWHTFCQLLDMTEFADVPLFQSSVGRLGAIDVLEPIIRAKLLQHSAETLFYRGQEGAVPLARVPTMEELFEVDQFVERQAFTEVSLGDSGRTLRTPSVPFRLFATPPMFGGPVATLGQHTQAFA